MFRTRDFLLFALTAGFLVVAIGGTVIMRYADAQVGRQATPAAPPVPAITNLTDGEIDYTATLAATDTITRSQRLASMRQKITARGELISAPQPELEQILESEEVITDLATSSQPTTPNKNQLGVKRCATYGSYQSPWSAATIEVTEGEGARLVTDTTTGNLIMTLPLRSTISPQKAASCLETDVVGIARDGSLIRNNESSLYGVFGPETIVGYALDGFPIYGTSNTGSLDPLGGEEINGAYGYYINPADSVIIRAFAGTPQRLP